MTSTLGCTFCFAVFRGYTLVFWFWMIHVVWNVGLKFLIFVSSDGQAVGAAHVFGSLFWCCPGLSLCVSLLAQ